MQEQLSAVRNELRELQDFECLDLCQHAHMNYLISGDKDSSFFACVIKTKNAKNFPYVHMDE